MNSAIASKTLGIFVMSAGGLLLAAGGPCSSVVIGADTAADHKAKPFGEQIWEGYYKARVHMRYHDAYARTWGRCDVGVRVVTLVLGVTAFSIPLVFGFQRKKWKMAFGVVGMVALIVALIPGALPLGDWQVRHADSYREWTNLAKAWDDLRNQRGVLPDDELRTKVRELRSKETSIEAMAEPPGCNVAFLSQCQAAENRFQGAN